MHPTKYGRAIKCTNWSVLRLCTLDCDCIKIGTRLPFCVSNSEKYNLLKKDYLNFLVTRKNHETVKLM